MKCITGDRKCVVGHWVLLISGAYDCHVAWTTDVGKSATAMFGVCHLTIVTAAVFVIHVFDEDSAGCGHR